MSRTAYKHNNLVEQTKLRTEKLFSVNLELPQEMSSNNTILEFCPISNQVKVNCGGATRKYAMWCAIFFKISKNLLFQRNTLSVSLLGESTKDAQNLFSPSF